MSDRIAVMSEGEVQQIGSPEEIYSSPASIFVAGFIGVANLVPVTVQSLAGEQATVQLPDGGRTSVRRGSNEVQQGIMATLMVRPERIKVVASEPSGDIARLSATVSDLTFQGPLVRTAASAADGSEVVAHIGPEDDLPALRPGSEVWLTWDHDAAWLLPGVDPRHGATADIDEIEKIHFAPTGA